jgi:hypothetical protein
MILPKSLLFTLVFLQIMGTAAPAKITFIPTQTFTVSQTPDILASGAFNRDGRTGVAVATKSNSGVTTYVDVSTTPAEKGGPCGDFEDCESHVCLGRLCCEHICPSADHTCGVPGFDGESYRLRDNGETCTYDAECLSAHCTDGVCCNVANCPDGERCSICGLEGVCSKPLMPGEYCCDDDLSCTTGFCTDGLCCRVGVCPEGDVCSPPDGFCNEAPSPTPTPAGQGGHCHVERDCQPGLVCENGVCCNEHCRPGYLCSAEQGGICIRGPAPPTRTPRPTEWFPSATPIPTPTCPPGFIPVGGLCSSASDSCVGDCNQQGTVTVDELVRGVNIALGIAQLRDCPVSDDDYDGQVAADELIMAVNAALIGCPVWVRRSR